MCEKFIRHRITEFRLRKGVSEYQMSYDLGHNRSYINSISSGKSMPSIKELLTIIGYFEITPADFFDENKHYPDLINKAIRGMEDLNTEDLEVLLCVIGQFCLMRGIINDLSRNINSSQDSKDEISEPCH